MFFLFGGIGRLVTEDGFTYFKVNDTVGFLIVISALALVGMLSSYYAYQRYQDQRPHRK